MSEDKEISLINLNNDTIEFLCNRMKIKIYLEIMNFINDNDNYTYFKILFINFIPIFKKLKEFYHIYHKSSDEIKESIQFSISSFTSKITTYNDLITKFNTFEKDKLQINITNYSGLVSDAKVDINLEYIIFLIVYDYITTYNTSSSVEYDQLSVYIYNKYKMPTGIETNTTLKSSDILKYYIDLSFYYIKVYNSIHELIPKKNYLLYMQKIIRCIFLSNYIDIKNTYAMTCINIFLYKMHELEKETINEMDKKDKKAKIILTLLARLLLQTNTFYLNNYTNYLHIKYYNQLPNLSEDSYSDSGSDLDEDLVFVPEPVPEPVSENKIQEDVLPSESDKILLHNLIEFQTNDMGFFNKVMIYLDNIYSPINFSNDSTSNTFYLNISNANNSNIDNKKSVFKNIFLIIILINYMFIYFINILDNYKFLIELKTNLFKCYNYLNSNKSYAISDHELLNNIKLNVQEIYNKIKEIKEIKEKTIKNKHDENIIKYLELILQILQKIIAIDLTGGAPENRIINFIAIYKTLINKINLEQLINFKKILYNNTIDEQCDKIEYINYIKNDTNEDISLQHFGGSFIIEDENDSLFLKDPTYLLNYIPMNNCKRNKLISFIETILG